MHSRRITVHSPLVNILLRRTLSVTALRNLPVNKSKDLFKPQTLDFLEKLALIILYNFHREHSLLNLKIKMKLSPKINVKDIKTRV